MSRDWRFAFYVGRGDTRFRAENLRLHRELLAAGVPHLFRLYPGAHAQPCGARTRPPGYGSLWITSRRSGRGS